MFSSIEFLQKVINTIEEAVIIQNLEGEIVAFNKQATEMLGLNEKLGKSTSEAALTMLVNENGEDISLNELPFVITLTTGKPQKNIIAGLKLPEGNIKWLKVNTQILEYQSQNYILATILDITENYTLQKEIKATKQRFKLALIGGGLGVWDFNLLTNEVYFSDEWKAILGYSSNDLESIFDQWLKLICPDDKEKVLKATADYLEKRSPEFNIEYRLLCKDGTYKWVLSSGKVTSETADGQPVRASGILKDISDKKRFEELFRSSEERFSKAFYHSAIGIALVSPEGKWVDVNPAICNMLGYTDDEISQLTFHDITHPDDLQSDLENVRKMLDREITTYSMEKRYIHKDGSVVWTLLTVSLVWEAGKPKFFISQIVDISDTKDLIEQLKGKSEQFRLIANDLKNKVDQLEEFNRIVAHNLRGPAANILMLSDMLTENRDSVDTYLPMLQEVSKSLDETLKDLIKILEIQFNTDVIRSECSFKGIIDQIIDVYKPHDFSITVTTDLKVDTIQYSQTYLKNILDSLISNAIKYRRHNIPTTIKIKTFLRNGLVNLSVEDNGLGIDMEKYGHQIFKLSKVFHKGFKSKGLGLFITKNQIETLGGSISVESKPEHGSTFKITF